MSIFSVAIGMVLIPLQTSLYTLRSMLTAAIGFILVQINEAYLSGDQTTIRYSKYNMSGF